MSDFFQIEISKKLCETDCLVIARETVRRLMTEIVF